MLQIVYRGGATGPVEVMLSVVFEWASLVLDTKSGSASLSEYSVLELFILCVS